MLKRTTYEEDDVGRRGRGDHDKPGRREGGQRDRGADRLADMDRGRVEDRAQGGQDEDLGYKERVHERFERMDARLERLERRLERLEGGGGA